ncbi:hypothetical protein BGZ96_001100 [Linnemannia gamsii]|uniref:F-box domain-containing protein n=1 Tax=Linnemannia gamsii TaxID=64522 RepID=A0ABQ7JMT4_9FUNG|nr:hypothetical protein BGZ96_001100 [Linnemannia gamsii]
METRKRTHAIGHNFGKFCYVRKQQGHEPTTGSPLELAHIRTRVATFLDRNDALSCMRVSRDWFHDFAPSVWHTIDFSKDANAFAAVAPDILDKYGDLISQVLNITTEAQLESLQSTNVDSLRLLQAQGNISCLYHQLLSDVIRRNTGSLQSIAIHIRPPCPDILTEQWKHDYYFLNATDAISSFYSLSKREASAGQGRTLLTLDLSYISISRESFSSLLQRCPSLEELKLHQVLLCQHKPFLRLFIGSKLRYLVTSFGQVWNADPNDTSAPCLLAHFPLLKEWSVTSMDRSEDITSTVMSQDITQFCPLLKNIRFDQGDPATATDLLSSTFHGLESCTISIQVLAASTILGLVSHQDSLTSVSVTSAPTTVDGAISARNTVMKEWLYMIPRMCRRLKVLDLGPFVCDMDQVGNRKWVCDGLQELRVRINGLNAPDNIEGCLQQVYASRWTESPVLAQPVDNDAISARVGQLLLHFKQLRTVCLGTKDYYLPPSNIQ